LQKGEEFIDSGSYQSLALRRTEEQVGAESLPTSKLVQYYALYSIFAATFAVPNVITMMDERFDTLPFFPGWISKMGWESNTTDPCPPNTTGGFNFEGIECENGLVIGVRLDSNFLTGAFPPEITLLAVDGPNARGAGNLQVIDLFSNPFLYNNETNAWMTDLGTSLGELRYKCRKMNFC
jgi:hypothetical protein